jgi:hypothetical protein
LVEGDKLRDEVPRAERLTRFYYDAPLIASFMHRWRPETHTFHLPVGEMTLSLEDAIIPNFLKETKCIPICMPRSSFMHIATYKCIQKQYHVRKRKIIRDLRFILETKTPNITGSRLGVAYA